MRVYRCDSCNKVIEDPYTVKMKEFYLGIAIPVEYKRRVKIHLCDECYKGLNLIGELVPKKRESENNDRK